jgi:WD40 repeat protein
LSPDFVIADTSDGLEPEQYSVVALSQEVVNPADNLYPNTKYLPFDALHNYQFLSRYVDILPNTNQVLISTKNKGDSEETGVANVETVNGLQLWNLETDELTLLVPGGIHGRFSSNHHYFAYLIYDSNQYSLHLLDRVSGNIIFSELATSPDLEGESSYSLRESAFVSFSPDGRTLTYYSPTPELMLYDLETGEFLPPLTAVPFTPLWSPDSSRFVYQHPSDGLSIFDTRTNTSYPLASSGGERLSDPQWSYDGTYLSVTVEQKDGRRDTAVLQLP